MDDDDVILERRSRLATVKGVRMPWEEGGSIEEAPCDMLLGNAIVHLASLDPHLFMIDGALVILEDMELDCATCRRLYEQYGEDLVVLE